MVTVKLLSIHAENEQTLDERNTLLTVGAVQGPRRQTARGAQQRCRVRHGGQAASTAGNALAISAACRSPTPLQDPAAVALNTQFMERMAGEPHAIMFSRPKFGHWAGQWIWRAGVAAAHCRDGMQQPS